MRRRSRRRAWRIARPRAYASAFFRAWWSRGRAAFEGAASAYEPGAIEVTVRPD